MRFWSSSTGLLLVLINYIKDFCDNLNVFFFWSKDTYNVFKEQNLMAKKKAQNLESDWKHQRKKNLTERKNFFTFFILTDMFKWLRVQKITPIYVTLTIPSNHIPTFSHFLLLIIASSTLKMGTVCLHTYTFVLTNFIHSPFEEIMDQYLVIIRR